MQTDDDLPRFVSNCNGCGALLPKVNDKVVVCEYCGKEYKNDPKRYTSPRIVKL